MGASLMRAHVYTSYKNKSGVVIVLNETAGTPWMKKRCLGADVAYFALSQQFTFNAGTTRVKCTYTERTNILLRSSQNLSFQKIRTSDERIPVVFSHLLACLQSDGENIK